MNAKNTLSPANVKCLINLGGYGTQILIDTKKAGLLFEMLAEATLVSNEWSKETDSVMVIQPASSLTMKLWAEKPMTRDEFDSMREAIRAAAEAEEAAALAAAQPVPEVIDGPMLTEDELTALTKRIHKK